MDAFGYGSGDPATEVGLQQAKLRALRDANNQSQYAFRAQIGADQALPGILMGLGGGQSMSGAQTPAPGQASTPFAQTPPQGNPMPQPPQSAGGGQGGGPNLSVMPPMAGGGPGQAPQSAPQTPPQGAGGGQPPQGGGYDLPSVVKIIQQQYPNIDGAALRNILTTINPLILTPQAKMQLEQMKMYMQQQRLPIMQENADSRREAVNTGAFNAGSTYANRFGQFPQGMPQGLPQQLPQQGGGGQPQIPQINAGQLQPPGGQMGGGLGGTAPTAPVKGQNQEAVKNADLRQQYTASMANDMQLSDNLTQLKTLLSNPSFGTGAAGDTRAQAAGVMYYLTGDPKWNDTATVAQLDQKAMAGILVDQVSGLAASGAGNRSMATDMMKKYVSQMKPEMAKTPDANKSVVEGATAALERNSLMKQFFNDVTQRTGIYPHQASNAVMQADRMYPLVTVNPDGRLQVNKDNIPKFSEALSRVSGNDYTSFSLGNGQEDTNRPLTSQEMEEYNRLSAAQGGK